MTTKDSFSIDIVLRHPSYSREKISDALSIKPQGAHAVGDKFGGQRAKWTSVYARLQEGHSPSEYENALAKVVAFLGKKSTFWANFMKGQGEGELILNHTLLEHARQGDLCIQVHLEPAFLELLSRRRIALRVQGWKGVGKGGGASLRG